MKLWSWLKNKFKKSGIVAVIRLEGVISTGGRFGGGINDQSLSPLIEKAFELARFKSSCTNCQFSWWFTISVITNRSKNYTTIQKKRYTGVSFL